MLRSAHAARACQQLRGAALRCPQRLGPRRARALSGARGAADGARADDPDGERDGGGGAVRVVYEADVDMRFRLLGAFGVCQGGFWGVFMYLNVAQPLPGTESPLAYAALGTAFSGGYVALAHAFASHSVKRLALARSAPPAGASWARRDALPPGSKRRDHAAYARGLILFAATIHWRIARLSMR